MPKQIVEDNIWSQRLKSADKYYKSWEQLFKCDILDKYYEGIQWKSQLELSYNPYVINDVYDTIQIKIAQFIPTFPGFLVSTRASNEDDLEAAASSAQLKEDLLNTITQDPRMNFAEEAEMAYKDSFFRFGIMEVGYAADWILNPNAPKPLLGKDTDTQMSVEKGRRIKDEPSELPQNERVYYKHVSAKTFRVGGQDHKYLNRCGWVGYYEFVNKDDLLSLKKLLNVDKIETASTSGNEPDRENVKMDSMQYEMNSLKIWRIWDLKARVQLLVLDSPCVTVFQRKFERLPLFDYRPDRRLITDGFYPIPPAYHWLSPQDEKNETREMLRAHRRRFVRKFQLIEGMMDDEEIEKFETGPDGCIVKVRKENAITPIENADLGNALTESIATSSDDLIRISGTSNEDRGIADRTTATQANIVNTRGALRENKERDRVIKWLSYIGRETLLLVRDKFTGRILVKLTQPEGESFLGTVQPLRAAFKYITSEDLKDGYDFKIDIDITSISQAAQVTEKQHLIEFLTILTQFPMVAFSPYLVREIAYRVGYRNEKAIAEFQKMALLMEHSRMNQLQAQASPQPAQMPPNGNNGQQIAQNAIPPNIEQIRQQLATQLPQTMSQQ